MPAEYSFVLAGKYGVGKTSLFLKLKNDGKIPSGVVEGCSRSSTRMGSEEEDGGLDSCIYVTKLNEKDIKVTLWDTGGQERFDSMTANYYRNAHAVILVYAVDDEATLFSLNEWVTDAKEVNRLGDRLTFATWGTKSDLPSALKVVKPDAVESMVELYNAPKHLNVQVTVFDNSVEEAMLDLVRHVDQEFNKLDTVEQFRDFDRLIDMKNDPPPRRGCCEGSR